MAETNGTVAPPITEMSEMKFENGNVPVPQENEQRKETNDANASAANNSQSNSPAPGSFKDSFKAFSKFGDTKSDGKHITLSQSDKWMKQARVIDGKKITTTDTGIYFKKLKQMKVTIDDYQKFLEDLAKNKKMEVDEIKNKMASCGAPGLHGVAVPKTPSAIDRLTDVSKYTGSHKQRFDESGKGKGIAGRKDVVDASGYVTGYTNKNTYKEKN